MNYVSARGIYLILLEYFDIGYNWTTIIDTLLCSEVIPK
jgi:hypothetical protein